jgi:rhodanese-related sulfurtransferase
LAEIYRAKGYSNVKALKGGVKAWKAKGYPVKPAP